ncbi:CMP-N-acetylneuraminate-beta-1,4-galactoside alpha-2,3-sialyltransferase-like isoform X1 [Hypomesus transpacificus]|uniref:CMP-N-acetylneuraminate-beta-1,4-galactoside alpha-2,3-sialyltransferase-like isoform X1 n=1 Tax=Hypomesus transpacificus TaxID=137520 RepID=UPI001F077781|nr:CMP-N-acetylneuraminate-beta-1,4-galactoside alpha-2,3-sialyltransferase-like isoform X1 [Hypomesus transpacificus]XP_046884385.1 CMP-N-acetylneuraminate-beta-1,4-galactoside alpha-2,3-sialyltransferase-like isoform X1 [Hypomesus transpacificus]
MKPTHKVLFVFCPMLVLVFIYYSSGKLHLHVWGHKLKAEAEPPLSVVAPTTRRTVPPDSEVDSTLIAGQVVGSGTYGSTPPSSFIVYDKQGFLLNLDGKLPAELSYKYGNLSEGMCKPGYAAAKMTTIYPK